MDRNMSSISLQSGLNCTSVLENGIIEGLKMLLPPRCCNQPRAWIRLDWRHIMDTLPPSAQNSKFTVLYPPADKTYRHYVYTLSYPDSMGGSIFYVGKGQRSRIHAHEWEARQEKSVNSYKCRVIRSIWKQGEHIVKTKLAFFKTHAEALQYEIALIFFLPHLTNLTDGGEGTVGLPRTSGGFKGRSHSAETRQRISANRKGKEVSEEARRKYSETSKGRVHSEEHRRKRSEALKGHVHSEETRRKISEATKGRTPHNKGKPLPEEQKQKLSASHKGKPVSDETKRKMSMARKGRVIPEEQRRRMIEANRGQKRSPEARARISAAAKLRVARKRAEAAQNQSTQSLWEASDE